MKKTILSMEVDITSTDHSLLLIKDWLNKPSNFQKSSRYVCVSNVHMCMEAYDSHEFNTIVNSADLVLPDGKPMLWAQKLLGAKEAKQVRGTDITLRICEYATQANKSIGFYGGTPEILDELDAILCQRFPGLNIVSKIAPPFRPLTATEDLFFTQKINESNVDILFVGIGCPKQEQWMAEHKQQLQCIMLGVGAAFDFLTGRKKEAPVWMQFLGLEWLFRLLSEPQRLWKRYLKHNPRFLAIFFLQFIKEGLAQMPLKNIDTGNFLKQKIFKRKSIRLNR